MPFKVSIAVIVVGAILSFTMHPEKQFTEEATPIAPTRTPTPAHS